MAKRTARTATRKTSGGAPRAAAKKPVTKAPGKLSPADKPRSKSEVYGIIADRVGISKKHVAGVFDVMHEVISKDLSKAGPGVVNVGGMMKVTVKRMPATKAREGINPFTKEKTMFKAKPARNVVKIRPLKALKDAV